MTRKLEVLSLALSGATDAEIAVALGVSRRTVRALVARLRASGGAIPTSAERRLTTDDDGFHGAPEPACDNPRDGAPEGDVPDDPMSVPL